MSFDGKVVVITGSGNGLGKDYAIEFAKQGAKVIVNDYSTTISGEKDIIKAADLVVSKIKSDGGEAYADYNSVENGEKIIQTAISRYGRIDVLVNNAGIIRVNDLENFTNDDWDLVVKIHLFGMFKCTQEACKYMKKQNFGRIVNVTSPFGIYGESKVYSYATAKAGVIGFTKSLALSFAKMDIRINCISPVAYTRMSEGGISQDNLKVIFSINKITPLVLQLAHPSCNENGGIFETQGGFISRLRFQRSKGVIFGDQITQEDIQKSMKDINDFKNDVTYHDEGQTTTKVMLKRIKQLKNPKF